MEHKLKIIISLFIILFSTNVLADNQSREFYKSDELFRVNGFLENKGQVGDEFGLPRNDVKYVFEKGNFKLILKTNSFSYELSHTDYKLTETAMVGYQGLPKFARYKPDLKVISHRVDIEFLNSNPNPVIEQFGSSEDYFNYYTNYTPSNGVEETRTFEQVKYIDIYPGIDIVFKSSATGVKYDIIVKPGGKLKEVRMKYSGADDIHLLAGNKIKIITSEGFIEESIPMSFFSEHPGSSNITESAVVNYKFADNILSFDVSDYDNQLYLTIDPEIVWGTYYGDIYWDAINAIQHDELNNVIASGYTFCKNNIATSGTYQTTYGGGMYDAFLVKISHSGSRLWATYCGGDSLDVANGVAADNVWHHIYIMGYTASRNGLVSEDCYQETYGGGYFDSFIGKFDMNGRRLWCTYFGGSDAHEGVGGEYLFNAATDERFNEVYFVGVVSSRDSIASQYAHQTTYHGKFDAVLAKFTPEGNREWATFYGGTEFDGAYGITLDPSGYITIGGYTESNNNIGIEHEEIIATEGAYQFAISGKPDGFIARFNLRGTRQWGTYFGGPLEDIVNCTAADKDKNIYIGGSTASTSGIATSGSHQSSLSGTKDGFIAKFSSSGTRLWSSYYGGLRYDEVNGMYCDSDGLLYLTGSTKSKENIATPGSFQPVFIGRDTTYLVTTPDGTFEAHDVFYDGFIAHFNSDGSRNWGTYFGGWDDEIAKAVAVDLNNNFLIGGYTQSISMLTTPGTFKPTYTDTTDGFIMKFGEFMRLTNITTPFCVGNPITLSYETGTEMNSGNIFTAQLSDSTGNFSSPVNIGTKTATKAGTIDAVIPKATPPGNGYRIRIVSTNPAKTSKDNGYDITISPLPVPVIQGDSPACTRENEQYYADLGANVTNKWSITNGQIIGDSTLHSVIVRWNDMSFGKLKVIQTNNVTGCVDSVEKVITLNMTPTPIVNGTEDVLSYTTHIYSSSSQANWNYLWTVTGGVINGSNTSTQIEVTWGSVGVGTVKLVNTHKTTGCRDSLTLNVAINSMPVNINGKKAVCAENLEEYYINPETDLSYKWLSSGGVIQGDDADTLVKILWGQAGSGNIKLIRTNTKDKSKDTVAMNINIQPLPNTNIVGSDENCEDETVIYYTTNTENVTNEWSVYNGELIGDVANDSITVVWNKIPVGNDSISVTGNVSLKQTSTSTGCEKVLIKNVNIGIKPRVQFIGSNEVCENDISFYFNRTKESVVSNKWSVTGGTIIGDATKDTLQVNWGEKGVGSVELMQVSITYCTDSLEIPIDIVDIPERPTITQSGNLLISSADFGNQWYVDGEIIEGANSQQFEPDSSGLYTVKVVVSTKCESPISAPYNFVKISVEDIAKSDMINIYPNPTSGKVVIEIRQQLKSNEIVVRNLLGEVVKVFSLSESENSLNLDLSEFPAGVYHIQFITNNGLKNYKIMKY